MFKFNSYLQKKKILQKVFIGLVPSQSPVPMVGTLNAAQTQYLTQLTQQNSDVKTSHIPAQTYGAPVQQQAQQYSGGTQYAAGHSNAYASTGYPPVVNASNYGTIPETQPTQQQPVRTKTQRARVPPPSKVSRQRHLCNLHSTILSQFTLMKQYIKITL